MSFLRENHHIDECTQTGNRLWPTTIPMVVHLQTLLSLTTISYVREQTLLSLTTMSSMSPRVCVCADFALANNHVPCACADFGRLVKICSWSHMASGADFRADLASIAKVRLANLAKRFIDCGRVLYLQERGFHVDLKTFVDTSVTKENRCLLAWPKTQSSE